MLRQSLAIGQTRHLGLRATQIIAPKSMTAIAEVSGLEILRPLVGMDKDEISDQAQAIGTLAISNIPDQDCCTLFTPRNPATRARLDDVLRAEEALPIEEMVSGAVAAATIEDFTYPSR